MSKHTLKSIRGFTLIEMSVVIMLMGVALAAAAPLYNQYIKEQELQKTRDHIELVSAAVSSYRSLYGRYPLPAPVNAIRTDPRYGHEAGPAPQLPALPPAPTGAPGTLDPVLGVYISRSLRTAFTYLNPFVANNPPVTQQPRVRTGFVPFRILNLPEEVAYDGHGNHIIYSVTEHLAFDTTFRPAQGGISIVNNVGANLINPQDSADYVLYSMGENESGAFPQAGAQFACAPGLDQINCTFPMLNPRFRQAAYNTQAGLQRFDDVLSYFILNDVPLWQLSSVNSFEDSIHSKPPGEVGIAFNPASLVTNKGDVLGEIRAQDDPQTNDFNPATTADVEGSVISRRLCSSGADCFDIELITGLLANPTGGMECPADDTTGTTGTYMVGIQNGQPICENEVTTGCYTPGEALMGFDANNIPICQNVNVIPQPCPASSTIVCNGSPAMTTVPLPASPHGSLVTLPAAGYVGHSRQEFWECTNGSWNLINGTGLCTCPATETRSQACLPGFTGAFTQTRTNNCATIPPTYGTWLPPAPTGPVFTYPPGSGCTCQNIFEPQNLTCPAGHSPPGGLQPRRERTFTCSSTTSGSWSAWTYFNWPCTCGVPNVTRPAFCPSPLTGSFTQTSSFNCAATPPAWTAWTPATAPGGTCTCTPRVTDRTGPCPPGETGTITYRDTVACPAGTLTTVIIDAPVPIGPDCVPTPPVICTLKPNGNSTGSGTARMGPDVSSTCTCGGGASIPCSQRVGSNFIYYSCTCGP